MLDLETPGESRTQTDAAPATPLVSIIVRSMGRPQLRAALESIAGQDYPAIETIVVDATGGRHPPLPAIDWRAAQTVRRIDAGRPLPRPQAANVGLRAASGEWFAFLDDDDTCDPHHISALVAEAARHPDALMIYGKSRWLNADGGVERLFGRPFNRLLVHFGPLFCWQAALISSRVVDLGCRFDEAFTICEDRDFIAQVAHHREPVLVPVVAFNFRPDLGTSGTGNGANWDPGRTVYYDQLLRAKWAGDATFHAERSAMLCLQAVRAFESGDHRGAQAAFERALVEYPEDPNALHGIARLAFERDDLATAERYARLAIDVHGHPAEYRLTLAEILARRGAPDEAADEAARAAEEPVLRERANALLRSLPTPATQARMRTERCPCGSGLRYKRCCGQLAAEALSPKAATIAGDVRGGLRDIPDTSNDEAATTDRLRDDATLALQLGMPEQAVALLAAALQQRDEPATRSLLADSCRRLFDDWRSDALWATAREVLSRIDRRHRDCRDSKAAPRTRRVHVIGDLRPRRRDRVVARALARALAPHADIRLWSTQPAESALAHDDAVPTIDAASAAQLTDDTVILLEADDPPGAWFDALRARRLVLRMRAADPELLVRRLAYVEANPSPWEVRVAMPGRDAAARVGPAAIVDYAWLDDVLLDPPGRGSAGAGAVVIGRHGAEPATEHHPLDAAMYRRLMDRGHQIRILGGGPLVPAFAGDAAGANIALLAPLDESRAAFLGSLDVYLYRRAPWAPSDGGARVLEAMAAGRPVVVFAAALDVPECVEHERTGFVVTDEDEAFACIERLAADPSLRQRIGSAARAASAKLMTAQRYRVTASYVSE